MRNEEAEGIVAVTGGARAVARGPERRGAPTAPLVGLVDAAELQTSTRCAHKVAIDSLATSTPTFC